MKKIFLLLLIKFIFFKKIFCENDPDKDEQIKQMVNYYIKEFGYQNMKYITREEFRKLFLRLFESKQKDPNESKEDSDINFSLTNALFDFIVTEDKKKIELDKIYDYFDPNNIINALKALLKNLGMEKLIDEISEPLIETLKQKGKNENIITNDKNDEL